MRKLCFVTTTRADYGLIKRLLRLVSKDPELKLQLIVSGTHLSEMHGKTISEITKDGFRPNFEIAIYQDSAQQANSTQEAFVRGVQGFTKALSELAPDIVVLTGDRYEMLAAAICALIQKVPAAHLFAGDVTEGAFDESIRHSITKMSQIHFTSHEAATRRVCQMGENPATVFTVGNPGLDGLSDLSAPSWNSFQAQTGYAPRSKNILVTFHPCTLENNSVQQLDALLAAIIFLQKKTDMGILFTQPNADPEGNQMADRIRDFCSQQPNCKLFASLGHQLYFNAVQLCDAVVGNSSSGIYEVPLFKRPTVNIGDRQKGRPQAKSILNCQAESSEIIAAIESAWKLDCSTVENLYGDGHSSQRIYDVLRTIKNPQELIKKRFFDQTEPYAATH